MWVLPVSVGMWGSAFAASLYEIFLKTGGLGLGFLDPHRGSVNVTGEGGGPCSATTTSQQRAGAQAAVSRMRGMDKDDSHFSPYLIASHLDGCPKFRLQDPTRLPTRRFTPQSSLAQAVLDIFTSRFTCAQNFNFTRGLCLYKDYVASRNFVAWKGVWHCGEGKLFCFDCYVHRCFCLRVCLREGVQILELIASCELPCGI